MVMLLDDMTATRHDLQVQSIAHAVIRLEHQHSDYGSCRRRPVIVKYRGHAFRSGYHDYKIELGGLRAFPRLVAADHTACVVHARTALETAASVQPSIAILDIGMPRMDGYELAHRLRADPKHQHLALVALTGWGQASHWERIAKAGFDRHLLKPVDIGELTRTLRRLALPPAAQKHRA